jgi:lysophospholipase L1-like esterase
MKKYSSQRICVFGDSIAWGAEDQEKGGWVDRLKVFVKKTGKFHEVFNLANPGKDSNYLVERMEPECAARLDPEHREDNAIVVQIGINDSQQEELGSRQKIELEKTKENIEKIIRIAKKYVENVVFVGMTSVDEEKTTPLAWTESKHQLLEDVKKYNDGIRSVCNKKGVHFVDVLGLLTNDDLHDGLHPNENGHEKIFQKVKDFLIEKDIVRIDKNKDGK